jgi:hypothetical protein
MHYITIVDVIILFWKFVSSGTILLKLFCQRKKLTCLLLYYHTGSLGLYQQGQNNVSLVSYYDIHEDEQNGFVTEGKNRGVCWRRCNSCRGALKGSTHGTSFSSHSVVNENEYLV